MTQKIHTWALSIVIKFMFSKKATKIDEIFTVYLTIRELVFFWCHEQVITLNKSFKNNGSNKKFQKYTS